MISGIVAIAGHRMVKATTETRTFQCGREAVFLATGSTDGAVMAHRAGPCRFSSLFSSTSRAMPAADHAYRRPCRLLDGELDEVERPEMESEDSPSERPVILDPLLTRS